MQFQVVVPLSEILDLVKEHVERSGHEVVELSGYQDYGFTEITATVKQGKKPVKSKSLLRGGGVVYRGERMSVSALAKSIGVSKHALYHRLNRGWSIEEAAETPIDERLSAQATATANRRWAKKETIKTEDVA